jgi:hypothetical protein
LLCAYHNRTVKAATDRTLPRRRQPAGDPLPCIFDHEPVCVAGESPIGAGDPGRAPPEAG